jgi:hypothetical protein
MQKTMDVKANYAHNFSFRGWGLTLDLQQNLISLKCIENA